MERESLTTRVSHESVAHGTGPSILPSLVHAGSLRYRQARLAVRGGVVVVFFVLRHYLLFRLIAYDRTFIYRLVTFLVLVQLSYQPFRPKAREKKKKVTDYRQLTHSQMGSTADEGTAC